MKKRVVITGYGMITPLGRDAEETFQRAAQGRSGIDFIKSFDTSNLPCRIGGEIDDQWLHPLISDRLTRYTSRGGLLFIKSTEEAYRMAQLETITDRYSIGLSVGSHGDNPTVKDMAFLHRYYDGNGKWDTARLWDAAGGYQLLNFMKRKPDMVSALVAHRFDARGINITTASACAAGAQAIGEAFRAIRDGRAKVMIAGGAEAVVDFFGLVGFISLKALSERYVIPQTASRPFDRKRNGFVISEGSATLILEDYGHALKRGVTIYGELLGYGASADAYRITDIHPEGLGAVIAMRKAIKDANLTIEDVQYINAHGTSTVQNDLIETLAIKKVFGERAKDIPVSSNKSMLGHTIAAAGAIECVLTMMGINNSLILPTINYEYPDPRCDLNYVPNQALRREHIIALSNSFGFGGQNACLCIGKYTP